MLRNYKGISVDGFIAIYRMIYNLVFFKGEEKESVLTHSSETYYLKSIFPNDEERLKKEFGGEVPNDIVLYNKKYHYKLYNNTMINFFLYIDETNDISKFYQICHYNYHQIFANSERYIDIFISDKIFNKKTGLQTDIKTDFMMSKQNFVKLLIDVFDNLFPNQFSTEAFIALIIEVILEGGHKQIDDVLNVLMDKPQPENPFISYVYNDMHRKEYGKDLDKIIKKYADMKPIKNSLDPQVHCDINYDELQDLLISYLNEISVLYDLYQSLKIIPL